MAAIVLLCVTSCGSVDC